MSFVPFLGLSNFYKGNKFDGYCELINAVMIIISILAACCCFTHRIANCIAGYIAIVTVFLDLAKVFHMLVIGSADTYEIIIIVISIALIYLYCCCMDRTHSEVHGIIPALFVTVATGTLETFRDIYTAKNYDRDGNDCPFV